MTDVVSPRASVRASSDDAGFAGRLREATKMVHREAERTGVLADLIRGRATREGYAVYLRNLVPIYATLEAGLAGLDPPSPLLSAFADPALRRLPHLLADLAAVAGPAWAQICPLLPEAEFYAASIADTDAIATHAKAKLAAHAEIKLAAHAHIKLAAHAYARYLGDLSGGQILRPLLVRSLGLEADALAFYEFPGLADLDGAKQGLRAALDTLPATGEMADAIIAEAIAAFRHNIALSTAVSAALQAVAV